ncbi:hypothetical protein scyTo_0011201 [Scyliorhinus torazame]|uniref:CRIB domain-containing protein n=1 Tax=Scyliorhinus torazame TaxID=75743 RepID=A0A401NIY0_SCYTO|nr:hypothetical protein [Scyliorhinus torazame]
MSEFWLCFNCCIAEQPQPKRRRRIDRSMIGEPTNFVHTSHMGAGDMFGDRMNSVIDHSVTWLTNNITQITLSSLKYL